MEQDPRRGTPEPAADPEAESDDRDAAVGPPQYCYRHPNEVTRVHCTRCGRPICPECMVEAPVGYQCPECVEEARRDYRAGPPHRVRRIASTPVTTVLLWAIGAAFVVELVRGQAGAGMGSLPIETLVELGASVPLILDPAGTRAVGGIAAGESWRLLSAVFLHGSLIHLAVNGFVLWNLGQFVERTFGRWRTLLLFFLTGFLASVASFALGPVELARLPGTREIVAGNVSVGASGAVFGFFGAYVAYNLRRRHLAQSAASLRSAAFLIVLNVVFGFTVPGIDNRAHLGGLVAGFLAGWLIDGVGPRRLRPAIGAIGLVTLVAVGLALTVAKTAQIRSLLPSVF